jgi:RNA polymerase sigma-70 factor (ECF subfamily)
MAELEDLIRRCQEGELDAFGKLFRRYEGRMYRLAVAVLHLEQDAEDALQDSCLRVFERIRSYRGDASFETWLTAIVLNVCRDRLRRRKVRQWLSLGRRAEGADIDASELLDTVAGQLEKRMLWAMVDRLEDRHRLALVLRYQENLSCVEIAQAFGVPVRTVYSYLDTGRAKLRAMFQDDLDRQERREQYPCGQDVPTDER